MKVILSLLSLLILNSVQIATLKEFKDCHMNVMAHIDANTHDLCDKFYEKHNIEIMQNEACTSFLRFAANTSNFDLPLPESYTGCKDFMLNIGR